MSASAYFEKIATYQDFLRSKMVAAPERGFEISADRINPLLKPHQAAIVRWALHKGCAAIFAAFGLGKTFMQLEIGRLVQEHTEGKFLIVAPLGVRQEFKRDADKLDVKLKFVRRFEECDRPGIYLTNYETVRDSKLDPRKFTGASLDEAAVLRGFGGTKTFREFMRVFENGQVQYKFVATATPSPNDFIELLAYAAFLDVMDVSQAKTRFFKRDSTKADNLTLHPHKEREFWLWVSSWAIFLQRPSDLGHEYSDEGYDLPPLEVRWHEIPSDHTDAGHETSGQGRLIRSASIGVTHAAKEKRESLAGRISKLMEIRAENPEAHRLIWHDLESERKAIEDALPIAKYENWLEFKDGNSRGLALYERHYSARKYADGRKRELFCGPGEKTVLLTEADDALFVWRKFIDDSGQQGVNCAVFRNEGELLSSDLIREACAIAWSRWPNQRLYTYVDPEEIESSNPGYCFLMAGWQKCGVSKAGQIILEFLPGSSVPKIQCRAVSRTVYGSQDMDERERLVLGFADGKIQELAGKPSMLGAGVNFQYYCCWIIYLGIGFKFYEFIQGLHRVYRFLQSRPVRVDLIYTEAEREIRKTLEEKWAKHNELVAEMTKIIRQYGLGSNALAQEMGRSIGCEREEVKGENFTLVHNDAVLETLEMPSDSVHLVLTSIPFSTQYEYSPSYNDFGHSETNEQFWEQMDYLIPELYRVLQPGRVAAIHVKDRIVPGGLSGLGFQTAYPFHCDTIKHFQRGGFAYLGMKTIVTDVVRENNQTYRLGWTEQCKDGSRMGVGMPEYLLLFRKPPTDSSNGYADVPVIKEKANYTRSRWQIDAHGFARSAGNRLLSPEDLVGVPHERIFKMFRKFSSEEVYNFEHHVKLSESLETCQECGHVHVGSEVCGREMFAASEMSAAALESGANSELCSCRGQGRLPVTFMLFQPQSWHPDVWTDITRMLSLNSSQAATGREMHLCPMQFDLADRVIAQFSMEGETVFDPFVGIGTVPYRAIKLKRRGIGCELSGTYFTDAVYWCQRAEQERESPTLFDLEEIEA